MKNKVFEDAVCKIGDSFIQSAIETDTAEKLHEAIRQEQHRKRMKLIRNISSVAACLCLCMCVGFLLFGQNAGHDQLAQVDSPVTEVSSINEMQKYLGFTVPSIQSKTASGYILYAFDNYAQEGEIKYTDGSGFKISRGSGDISGVYGATLIGSANYDSVTVYCYSFMDLRYAVWSCKGYACCYYAADGESDYSTIISGLINMIGK